jgi:Ser/Thr protein kinase RdoA (MazF antagonist)
VVTSPFVCDLATTAAALVAGEDAQTKIAAVLSGYQRVRELSHDERTALKSLVIARAIMGMVAVFERTDHPYLVGGHGARYWALALRRIHAAQQISYTPAEP